MGKKREGYAELAGRFEALLGDERDFVANAANAAALLYRTLPDVSWAGFYLLRGDVLVLGPFQGKPACVRIPVGKGVCGTAAARREALVVPDVHAFPGHIACDPDSRSEVVLPLVREDVLWGVLDLDSPLTGRFDEEDRAGLEALVATFLACTEAP
jgi:GAF domain-containing protein